MAKYKVGDKVRIVNRRTILMNKDGKMDKWLGKTMTIREVFLDNLYYMREDESERTGGGWIWHDEMISGLAEPEKPADENLSVTIRFCGRMTVAELCKNGRVVKVENARCNPKDTYSRAEGARIAVERLFEKKGKESKPKVSKPKVGDKFVIVGKTRLHGFHIGEIVTLVFIDRQASRYKNRRGLRQWVCDCDVSPYKENSK